MAHREDKGIIDAQVQPNSLSLPTSQEHFLSPNLGEGGPYPLEGRTNSLPPPIELCPQNDFGIETLLLHLRIWACDPDMVPQNYNWVICEAEAGAMP